MNNQLEIWLGEFIDEFELHDAKNINDEAQKNMHGFSLSANSMSSLTTSQINSFILGCAEHVQTHIKTDPCVFYCWYDSMADQLRFSIIRQQFGALPFVCELEPSNLQTIASHFWHQKDQHSDSPLPVWSCALNNNDGDR